MYIRMSHWKCKPECREDAARLFESDAVPMMRAHHGFVQALLLARPGQSERIAFTVWADHTAYEDFAHSDDLARIIRMFKHMYLPDGHPDPVVYEVHAQGASS